MTPLISLVARSVLPLTLLLAATFAEAALPPAQRAWLVALYNSTNGATALSNWQPGNLASDPCDDNWVGVDCNAGHTTVSGLVLLGRGMAGTLPAGWDTALPDVEVINLSINQLTGMIPGPLPPKVHSFRVDGNQLSGPVPEVSAFLASTLLSDSTHQGGSRLCPNKLEWNSAGQIFWNFATGRYPWYHDTAFPAEACSYTITPSAGVHGSISPATAQTALPLAQLSFTATAAAGYLVDAVGGTCQTSLTGAGANWVSVQTIQASKDCTVSVTFRADPSVPPGPGPAAAIPTLGGWAMGLLGLLLALFGTWRVRRIS